jgi:hypothetical protein
MEDRIIEGYLKTFVEENAIQIGDEAKNFEHFINYCIASKYIFDAISFEELSVGEGHDTGIDGMAIVVNGHLITSKEDIDFFKKTLGRLDVQFVFAQSKTSSKFDSGEIGKFIFGELGSGLFCWHNTPVSVLHGLLLKSPLKCELRKDR